MEAWRSMSRPWKIPETSLASPPTQQVNPREGWSWLSQQCLIWQTAQVAAEIRHLSPLPLTSWPPPRLPCLTTRQEGQTGGSHWWSWQETLPSLGGAVKLPHLESGCSRSSTTALVMTHWFTGLSVCTCSLSFFLSVCFNSLSCFSMIALMNFLQAR